MMLKKEMKGQGRIINDVPSILFSGVLMEIVFAKIR